jgi:hypothetical protein
MSNRDTIDMIKAACYDDKELLCRGRNPNTLRIGFGLLFQHKAIIERIESDEIIFDSGEESYDTHNFYRIYHSVIVYKKRLVLKTFYKYFNPITFEEYETDLSYNGRYKNLHFIRADYLDLYKFIKVYQASIIDIILLFGNEIVYRALEI